MAGDDGNAAGRKAKRTRHNFTDDQYNTLMSAFCTNTHPDQTIRAQLAHSMNIKVEIVMNWFTNQRQKMKKEYRFQRQMETTFRQAAVQQQMNAGAIPDMNAGQLPHADLATAPAPGFSGVGYTGYPYSSYPNTDNHGHHSSGYQGYPPYAHLTGQSNPQHVHQQYRLPDAQHRALHPSATAGIDSSDSRYTGMSANLGYGFTNPGDSGNAGQHPGLGNGLVNSIDSGHVNSMLPMYDDNKNNTSAGSSQNVFKSFWDMNQNA